MYIQALKSWWVSMFCFESKPTALRALLSNTLNPTYSILGPALCEQNAFVFALSAARINFKEIIKVNPRQHLQLQNTQHLNLTASLLAHKGHWQGQGGKSRAAAAITPLLCSDSKADRRQSMKMRSSDVQELDVSHTRGREEWWVSSK